MQIPARMLSFPYRQRKKKCRVDVVVGDEQSSSPQTSVNLKQYTVVPDTPTTSATTVSASAEAPKEKAKKASWWRRWPRHKKKLNHKTPVKEDVAEDRNLPSSATESVNTVESKGEVGVLEASSTPDTPVSAATETGKKKKKAPWLLFSACKKQKLESLPETDEGAETAEVDSDGESTKAQPNGESTKAAESDVPDTRLPNPSGHGGSLQAASCNNVYRHRKKQFTSANIRTISREERDCLGFPNLAQTCYLNSTLQSLLTLSPFVQEVDKQQRVWQSHPKSQLMREFTQVGLCHFTNNNTVKKSVLAAFKETVAGFNSEYLDDSQKDAHEFLNCVLDELKSLSPDLQIAAVNMGISYTCPVDAHIAFQMLSTRTCNGCGMQSKREEDYINLSLDLVPEGSVSQCLQEYLKERQVEYQCECGAEESSQQCSFLTLPNVLILQLKRFRFTHSFNTEKLPSPIVLSRELVVDPESNITTQTKTRYSLVSIVSHLGTTAHSGHYISDGVYPEKKQGDKNDRWLTYNDSHVRETTGASVCQKRRGTAYMLFYEKQK